MYTISSSLTYIIYLLSFSGFLNFYILGTTSNPLFFILSLIIGSKIININLLKKYALFPVVILIGTIISFLLGNRIFDIRFLFTLACVYLEFFLVQNVAIYSVKMDKNKTRILFNRIASLLIFIFLTVLTLNIFNLHCFLFKCREYGRIGFSLMTSEPSYVGLIAIFYLSFYFISIEHVNQKKRNLLLLSSFIMTVLSRSLNVIFSSISIAIWLVWPYFLNLIKTILFKFKVKKYIKYFIFILPIIIIGFLYLYSTPNIQGEVKILLQDLDFRYLFNKETFNILNVASGDRINYLMASLSSDFSTLFSGHGLLSSSSIFEDNLLKVYEVLDNNYEVNRGLKELGSKPHTLFGLIFFSNGIVGLIYLFKDQLLILKRHTLEILNNSNYINNKYFTQKNFFTILPFVLLIYPSTNTDTFKFISFYIYFIFFYGSLRKDI